MAFPATLDDLSESRASSPHDPMGTPDHYSHHVSEDTAIQALQAKVGVDDSAVVTSLDYILKSVNSINPGHLHNVLAALDGVPANAVYVDASGNVGIGTTGPDYKLHVTETITTGSGAEPMAYLYLVANQGANTNYAPVAFKAKAKNTGAGDITNNLTGFNAQIEQGGAGTITLAKGADFSVLHTHATSAITTAVALQVNSPYFSSNGTIGTNYGLRVKDQSHANITTAYGIYIEGDTDNYIEGNVGIGTTIPTAKLDINSDVLRLRTAKTPASAGAAGNQGDICWDADYIYICVATNTWQRVAHATW